MHWLAFYALGLGTAAAAKAAGPAIGRALRPTARNVIKQGLIVGQEVQRLTEEAILRAEPLTGTRLAVRSDDSAIEEFRSHGSRLAVGGAVLLGLLLKRVLFGATALAGSPILFAVSTIATIVSGYPFLRGGFRAVTGRGSLDTDALITAATIASLALRENVTALI